MDQTYEIKLKETLKKYCLKKTNIHAYCYFNGQKLNSDDISAEHVYKQVFKDDTEKNNVLNLSNIHSFDDIEPLHIRLKFIRAKEILLILCTSTLEVQEVQEIFNELFDKILRDVYISYLTKKGNEEDLDNELNRIIEIFKNGNKENEKDLDNEFNRIMENALKNGNSNEDSNIGESSGGFSRKKRI